MSAALPPPEHRFKPGQSGNPSGLPKHFRRPTDAIRQLVGCRGNSAEEVISLFVAARGPALCGADHLAIAAFRKACDPEARNGDAAFREILDRLEGPVVKNLKVQSETEFVINVLPYDQPEPPKASTDAALDRELRRKALQASALEAHVVDFDTSGDLAADGSPDEGE